MGWWQIHDIVESRCTFTSCVFHRSPTFEDPLSSVQSTNNMYYNDVASVNVHSNEFDSLPPEVQHEILLEREQIEKYSYHDPDTLPQVFAHVACYIPQTRSV